VINYDPQASEVNNNIAQTEAQTLAEIAAGPYPSLLNGPLSTLGKAMLYDVNLSSNGLAACATCHVAREGFSGGVSTFNLLAVDSPGVIGERINNRKPQTYGYATYAPVLSYRPSTGDFVGGNFWDMRATGLVTGNPASDQALGPVVNPSEMANPDVACVVWHIAQRPYAALFEAQFGTGSLSVAWPADTASICSQPGGQDADTAQPVNLSGTQRTQVMEAFKNYGRAIAAYEASSEVSPFTSKFDYYTNGQASLSPTEKQGYNLFIGKANCSSCHAASGPQPLFTDFTAVNLGIPRNNSLPWYNENVADSYGFVANPAGAAFIDEGVGDFLSKSGNADWMSRAENFMGSFKTATVRNAAQQRPGVSVKNYMHNGYFESLKQVVHFYNTAGALPTCPASAVSPTGIPVIGPVGTQCWPAPEEPRNVNRKQLGNLGLSDQEENAIVAFLGTLSDGYTP
jgi:cytochrome c peroxidase